MSFEKHSSREWENTGMGEGTLLGGLAETKELLETARTNCKGNAKGTGEGINDKAQEM